MALAIKTRTPAAWGKAACAWTHLPLRLKGVVVVSLPVAALMLSAILIVRVEGQKDEAAAAKHTLEVGTALRTTYLLVADADSSLGVYGLTRDKGWLQPLEILERDIEANLARIATSIHDHPEQGRRLARLKEAIYSWLVAAEDLREFYASSKIRRGTVPFALLAREKQIGAAVRGEYEAMAATENSELDERTGSIRARNATLNWMIAVSALVGLLGGILAALFLTALTRQVQAPDPEANDELGRLAKALGKTGSILSELAKR
jgi:CHASE3 domain sensor protein